MGHSRISTGRGGEGPWRESLGSDAPRIDCYGVSEKGSGRTLNEDEFLIRPLVSPLPGREPAFLLVVADGMGGAPGGERASSIALHSLHRSLRESIFVPDSSGDGVLDPGEALRDAVIQCQRDVEEDQKGHPDRAGMGTTLTAALVLWPSVHVVHVGHSRCYVLRGSHLEQLTVDHTMAQQMAHLGLLTPRAVHPDRWNNILSNVIGGTSSTVDPQVTSSDLKWGEAILLTTDGLTDVLSDEAILKLARREGDAPAVCRSLIEAAQEHGGRDDMTVIIARFGKSPMWRRLQEIFGSK
jgi:serine/threonine protein phosphatase PrpC